MRNADLSNADLKGLTIIKKTDFAHADFSGAVLDEATFFKCNFYNANFGVNKETKKSTSLRNSYFEECNLNRVKLIFVQAQKSEFFKCKMKEAACFGSSFEGAILKRIKAKKSNFINSNLASITIENSNFDNVLFNIKFNKKIKNESKPANLNNCLLMDVSFKGSKLNKVQINDSELTNVNFSYCQAKKMQMQNSSLFLINFLGSVLDYSDYTNSFFYSSFPQNAKSYKSIIFNSENFFLIEVEVEIDSELQEEDDIPDDIPYELFDEEYYKTPIKKMNFFKNKMKLPEKINFSEKCFFCSKDFKIGDDIAVFCCCAQVCCPFCANKVLAAPRFNNPRIMKMECPFCKKRVTACAKTKYSDIPKKQKDK